MLEYVSVLETKEKVLEKMLVSGNFCDHIVSLRKCKLGKKSFYYISSFLFGCSFAWMSY